jgi:hypothetical protein
MIPKEKIKQEIDQIPDELAEKVLDFIRYLKRTKQRKKSIRSFKLNGAYDRMNIRERAYE